MTPQQIDDQLAAEQAALRLQTEALKSRITRIFEEFERQRRSGRGRPLDLHGLFAALEVIYDARHRVHQARRQSRTKAEFRTKKDAITALRDRELMILQKATAPDNVRRKLTRSVRIYLRGLARAAETCARGADRAYFQRFAKLATAFGAAEALNILGTDTIARSSAELENMRIHAFLSYIVTGQVSDKPDPTC